MKKILPALICGFAAGVLNIVPYVKNFSCCLLIPAAAICSILLYLRSVNFILKISAPFSIYLGVMTGIFAALFGTFFDTLIIFITHNSDLASSLPEIEKMMADFPQSPIWNEALDLMYKISDQITEHGFSIIYTLSVLFSSLFINSIFGLLGGLLGRQIFRSRIKNNNPFS